MHTSLHDTSAPTSPFLHQSSEGLAQRLASPEWPGLVSLGLSPEQVELRRQSIGGSDANIIMSGDPQRVLELWEEKTGQREPADLSDRLPVMLGCWTEAFNRQWYEKVSGERIVSCGLRIACSTYAWRTCTLDGLVESTGAVWEAKHCGAFMKSEEVLERYMPQLQHNMAIAKVDRAILSLIFGNQKYEIFEVAADWLYQLDLLEAEEVFWNAVLKGEPPVALPPPPAPRVFGSREICLQGNNEWGAAAADWLQHRHAAKVHAQAATSLKSMLADDVGRTFGNGVEAKRVPIRSDHDPGACAMSGVYQAISAVASDLAALGVAKSMTNPDDGYDYRSIDALMNRLSPLLARHKLCILPRVLERSATDRPGLGGEMLVSVTLKVAFDLISSEDGSRHSIELYGEALDRGDKATAKALTAAYKSAVLQTFCVPVTGAEDTGARSIKLRKAVAAALPAEATPEPVQGWQQWSADIRDIIASCETAEALERVQKSNCALLRSLSREQPQLYAELGKAFADRRQKVVPRPRSPTSITAPPSPAPRRKNAAPSIKRSKANGAAAPVH